MMFKDEDESGTMPPLLPAELDLKIAVAQAKGSRHQQQGQPCQDAIAARRENGICVLALADGAGSAKHAEIGAGVVIHSVMRVIAERFNAFVANPDGARRLIVRALVHAVQQAARLKGCTCNDLASTLLFAATDAKSLLIGQLGDGRIGVRDAIHGGWTALETAWQGEYANETVFVTSAQAVDYLNLRVFSCAEMSGAVVMSDGAEHSLFSRSNRNFAPGLGTMAKWVEESERCEIELVLQENLRDVLRKRTTDDLSLGFLLY